MEVGWEEARRSSSGIRHWSECRLGRLEGTYHGLVAPEAEPGRQRMSCENGAMRVAVHSTEPSHCTEKEQGLHTPFPSCSPLCPFFFFLSPCLWSPGQCCPTPVPTVIPKIWGCMRSVCRWDYMNHLRLELLTSEKKDWGICEGPRGPLGEKEVGMREVAR